ncbi:MAG TPA: hypothetical protein VNA25_04960 [Phycisphaerae bacterium]|nr:hypothetical protein [Phycisphaerae bacterium]
MAKPIIEFECVPRGKVLADVTVRTGTWTLRGFRVMQPVKSGGIWVGWPSKLIGGGGYAPIVLIEDHRKKLALESLILDEYTKAQVAASTGSTVST